MTVRRDEVALYDPTNQPIVSCSQDDWNLVTKIASSGRLGRLGEFCTAYQGEVNETTDGKKGHISADPKDGPQILRGSAICLYVLREQSQGEPIFLREKRYLAGKAAEGKAWDHRENRFAFQRNSPQNNFRRLIGCLIPSDEYCCDTVSYVCESQSALSLSLVLSFWNSKLLDWYFRLGSTNSKVNEYQFNNLPVPVFEFGSADKSAVSRFRAACAESDFAEAFAIVEPILETPPFPATVAECMSGVVQQIIDIERARGEISRSERSALAPKAQPLQDFLDRMIYRMAGLTDDEARGLEARLARML